MPSGNERPTRLGTGTGDGPDAGSETTMLTGVPGATCDPGSGTWLTIMPCLKPAAGQVWRPGAAAPRPATAKMRDALTTLNPMTRGTETGLLMTTGADAVAVAPLLSVTVRV